MHTVCHGVACQVTLGLRVDPYVLSTVGDTSMHGTRLPHALLRTRTNASRPAHPFRLGAGMTKGVPLKSEAGRAPAEATLICTWSQKPHYAACEC